AVAAATAAEEGERVDPIPPLARGEAFLQFEDLEAALPLVSCLAGFRLLLRLFLAWFHDGTSFRFERRSAVSGSGHRPASVASAGRADRARGRCVGPGARLRRLSARKIEVHEDYTNAG